ncbi:dihydrodipicolinate synthase family protein [Pseudogulbenkiania sp. MAI-1]|uniref:dihydrodipicolinate synthase family protein n=1 Tax=Pseudogulbenkiania sp. MAI-1 TaxID=990370 RepID=UPI00045E80E4|nr:dihydrodipicolinate synthase family protein [Pseudogulbenkiania sp. MAI-1]
MDELRGVYTVVATPFKEDGAIDFEGFGNNLDYYADNGGYGVVVAGTLGEYSAMTVDERKQLFEFAAKRLDSRCPLMAGTIATTTKQVIELTNHVGDNGGVGVLLLSHPGLGLNADELYTYYQDVADNTNVKIMLYNNPGSNGIDMSFDLVKKLSEHPNIVAIKESSNDVKRISRIVDELDGSLTPFCGYEDMYYEAFNAGARGWVCLGGNIAPRMVRDLLDLVEVGETEKARELSRNYRPLARYFENTSKFIQATKYAMDKIGLTGGYCRRPRLPLSPAEKSAIDAILADVKLY